MGGGWMYSISRRGAVELMEGLSGANMTEARAAF